MFIDGNRIASILAAAAAGAWFVIGQTLSAVWQLGSVGTPLSLREGSQATAQLGYFYGVGVVILLLAAVHFGAAGPDRPTRCQSMDQPSSWNVQFATTQVKPTIC